MAILRRQQDVQINYRVDGDGDIAWLLFNGATLPLAFWDPVAVALATTEKVVRFDQRNAGASHAMGAFSLLDTAADAAAVLAHLELSRVIAVGHAWGGRVAQVFARDYPHLCEGLVICGTGGQFPSTLPDKVLAHVRDSARAGDKTAWAQALVQAYCAPGFAGRQPSAYAELIDLLWPPKRPSARWDAKIAPSSSYWGQSAVPTLLIYGQQDQFGTPANADDLQGRLSDVRRVDVPEAGHFVIREATETVVTELRQFAQSLMGK